MRPDDCLTWQPNCRESQLLAVSVLVSLGARDAPGLRPWAILQLLHAVSLLCAARGATSAGSATLHSVLILACAAAIRGILSLGLWVLGPAVVAKVGEEGAVAVVGGGGRLAEMPMLDLPRGHPRAHGVH